MRRPRAQHEHAGLRAISPPKCRAVTSTAVFFSRADDGVNVVADGQPRLIVQCGKRLVEQQDLRLRGEGAYERRALPHPARKLVGHMFEKSPQPVLFRERERLFPVFRRIFSLDLEGQGDVRLHRPARGRVHPSVTYIRREFSFPGGFPCTRMLPAVGESSPAASESTVVLPQPEGPITATNSPSYTQKLMPRAAGVSPVRGVVGQAHALELEHRFFPLPSFFPR